MVSYGAYLRLNELLDCQLPPALEGEGTRELAHHDELLFIIVHQVYELWMKQILFELDLAKDLLGQPDQAKEDRRVPETDIPKICQQVRRVNEILRLMHSQFTIIETMPNVNFLAFRDLLLPASGFQSVQFRELEIVSGLRDEDRLESVGSDYGRLLTEGERKRLEDRKKGLSLADAVFDWLSRTPVDRVFPEFETEFSKAFREYASFQAGWHEGNPNLSPAAREVAKTRIEQQERELSDWMKGENSSDHKARLGFLFILSYRDEPLLRWPATLLEDLIEFEERLRMFRYRHARMVERMIGFRTGTGGSAGVDYLDQTALRYRVFGPLLEGRSFLLDPSRLPAIPNRGELSFRF
ncbi:MAG TPA: tryptophan 2,3-dioxygenase [Planctomycetes bacterium]|nr:tryptophan 2,3-dioxygenase [Planctomycetota bacterium]